MSQTTTPTAWVPIAEASQHYSLSDDTIRRMIARGEIEARRFGPRLIRVNLDSILTASQSLQYVGDAA